MNHLKKFIFILFFFIVISSLFISCNFEAALKLFLVHINFGRYWIDPIRLRKCTETKIIVETNYTALLADLPERLTNNPGLNLCPVISPYLNSENLDVDISHFEDGVHKPIGCIARQRTAVIVPYRNRPDQLEKLLEYLNPILESQQLEYQIFILNQLGNKTFSRARLMNGGVKYLETQGNYSWDCYIFHDVDLFIQNPEGLYKCLESHPRHLSASIDKYHYTVPWMGITGGVIGFTPKQFREVNGYSNEYWGWGCEDDDMFVRIVNSCYQLEQASSSYYKFKMIVHAYEKSYKGDSELSEYFRFTMATNAHVRQHLDGMSSLKIDLSLESSLANRTIISAEIGEPGVDIQEDFISKYGLLDEVGESCFHLTPLLFLYITHMMIFSLGFVLYKYFKFAWFSSNDNPKINGYDKLDEDRLSLHSL